MPATINGGAAAPGPVTPTSDEAPGWQAEGFKGQGETDNPDCADYLAGDQPADDCKRFATLRAELAILGNFTLLELADGSYMVTRWNCCRPLADLRAVTAFVRQVGGPRG